MVDLINSRSSKVEGVLEITAGVENGSWAGATESYQLFTVISVLLLTLMIGIGFTKGSSIEKEDYDVEHLQICSLQNERMGLMESFYIA